MLSARCGQSLEGRERLNEASSGEGVSFSGEIDGVFMGCVLSSPENAVGFFVTGSMDWEGRTQECSSRPAVPFVGPCWSPVPRSVAFEGLCR